MIRIILLIFLLVGLPLRAEDFPLLYPALYSVTGVAADDVLNIREKPDATAAVIGILAPDAKGVEVISVADGWATVNAGEMRGYVAMQFLTWEEGPPWNTLQGPLTCLGTEPFWSLVINPQAGETNFQLPEDDVAQISLMDETWPGETWYPEAAVSVPDGLAILYPGECSDGMSERIFGIRVDVFLHRADRSRVSGCCLLGRL